MTYKVDFLQRDGLFGLLLGSKYPEVHVEATNIWTGCTYKATLINGRHCPISGVSYLTEWSINVFTPEGDLLQEGVTLPYENKVVSIHFATAALGDSLCWMGAVEKWVRKANPAKVYVSTSWNEIFNHVQYPKIQFLPRPADNKDRTYPSDTQVSHLLGIAGKTLVRSTLSENHANCIDWSRTGMGDTQNMSLGVELGNIRPHLCELPKKRLHPRPYVTLCTYTTQKAKHMLSNKSWLELIRYVKSLGFDVISVGNQHTILPEIIDGASPDIKVAMQFIRDAEFHIGLSSGLSWMAWALNKYVLVISNFTHPGYEFTEKMTRVISTPKGYGYFNNEKVEWDMTWTFDPEKDNHTGLCRSYKLEDLTKGVDELMRKRAIGSEKGTYIENGVLKPIIPLMPFWLPNHYLTNK